MQFGNKSLSTDIPQVMGILNVTPDSFSDGGQLWRKGLDAEALLQRAQAMVSAGASMLDVGGESTRPGAAPVSVQEELDRVIPAVELLRRELDVVISVDTSSPEVMQEAARAGCGLINDVRALSRPGALEAAAATRLPVCLMHMQGQPETMQQDPRYRQIVTEVRDYLSARLTACEEAGIARERIMLDPGFGFGKTLEHNLTLLQHLPDLAVDGLPLLVGLSRKSMIDKALGRPVDQRLAASLSLAAIAVLKGAWIIRVHDVPETYDAVMMAAAVKAGRGLVSEV